MKIVLWIPVIKEFVTYAGRKTPIYATDIGPAHDAATSPDYPPAPLFPGDFEDFCGQAA